MEKGLDNYFMTLPEQPRSAVFAIRYFLVNEMQLEEKQKFNTPFYYYKEKWFGFLSYNKDKNHEIYISFTKGFKVEHPALASEGRKQAKIYRINAEKDIDVKELKTIIERLKSHY